MIRCFLRAVLPPPRSSLSEDAVAVFMAVEEEARVVDARNGVTLEAISARTLLGSHEIVAALQVLGDAGMLRIEGPVDELDVAPVSALPDTVLPDSAPMTAMPITLPPETALVMSELPETAMPGTALPSTRAVRHFDAAVAGQASALYQVEFAHLSVDGRVRAAREADLDFLDALTFDPALQVRDTLLEHRGIPERILARLVATYTPEQACIRARRPLPEATKAALSLAVRNYYQAAVSDERYRFLVATDGSALPLLAGIPFDVATTQRLVADNALSPPLVRALADFAGSPPSLVTFLAGLPLARTQPTVRDALLAHPNLSPSRKRALADGL